MTDPPPPREAVEAAERWFESKGGRSHEGDIRYNGWCGADGQSLARALAAHADAEHARRLDALAESAMRDDSLEVLSEGESYNRAAVRAWLRAAAVPS